MFKRIKTLWVLSGWDIQSSKKEGTFTIDGILRPQPQKSPKMAEIIKRETATEKLLKEIKNE